MILQNPQYLVYLSLGLFVLPSVPFNRQAALIALMFFVSFASPDVRLWAILTAMVANVFLVRKSEHLWVAMSFVPLGCVAVLDHVNEHYVGDASARYNLYWADFYIALIRNALVPFGNDWPRAKATLRRGVQGYRTERTIYHWYVWQHALFGYSLNAINRFARWNKSGIFFGR